MSDIKSDASHMILLVDDDPAILEGVADLLRLYNYNVITAIDGSDALSQMQLTKPDIIVSDIMMPDMDGYEFFETVRANASWTTIPFIFLTARGQAKDIRLGNMLGADAYLTKPFDPEDLIVLVKSRLQRVHDIHEATQHDIDRMKNQLITIFSHELRTPLTYIYGYVNLLQEQHTELEANTVEDMLTGVQRGAERLVNLVEDLMLLVRIDSGIVEMEINMRQDAINLHELVQLILSEFKHEIAKQRLEVEMDIDPAIEIYGMELHLRDALKRVIDNALKFSHRGEGLVTVRGYAQGDQIVIEVIDRGIGIAAGKLDQIFERFKQLDRDLMEQQGIGLGLSIADTIITLHHGQLSIESEVGVGTTCRISLPNSGSVFSTNGMVEIIDA